MTIPAVALRLALCAGLALTMLLSPVAGRPATAADAVAFAAAEVPVGAPTTNPGGKSRFVVSVGNLGSGGVPVSDVRVRLGSYSFTGSQGAVTASLYSWSQADPAPRAGTGTISAGCTDVPTCEVRTAPGFTGAPTESWTGTFVNHGDWIRIDWSHGEWEEWTVATTSDGALARLTWRDSSSSTQGVAYGSNATFQSRRAMQTIASSGRSLPYRGTTWNDGGLRSFNQVFDTSLYDVCSTATWCLTHRQVSSTACACASSPSTAINYFVARVGTTDRRDTWEHWCQCLADGRGETCYSGNSHTKPLLQIIDDDNAWRGWVGVEVFSDQTGGNPAHGYYSTFSIAPSF
ncbi:hypothetical protein [Microbacterium resistens]